MEDTNQASYNRKPIPKSQKEISNGFIDPYDQNLGNPNNFGGLNRGHEQSFRGDTVKPLTIGIQDIDESIMFYFKNVIKPSVLQNGERVSVPIIYGAPERFKSFQKDGFYRDKNDKIMSPIILFKRTNLQKVRSLGNKLDANNPVNFGVFQKNYTTRNAYGPFEVLNNRIPEKVYYPVIVPDYVTLTYTCTIQTYYVEQLNKIIEAVNYASDSYWGNPERFKFSARIDSFSTINELTEGQDRIVKATFDISLNGYMIPDTIQKNLTSLSKFTDKAKIIFSLEATADASIFEKAEVETRGNRTVVTNSSTNGRNKEAQNRSTTIG
jgi:hypothetical protein